jgi:hypothetical protein
MKIELHRMTVQEVLEGYEDSAELGVSAYGGKLDIRPRYQREFVYSGQQRDEVIRTVRSDFPLNVMYWVVTDQGNFEVLDGQQRTISLGQYIDGDFAIKDADGRDQFFHNLTPEER